MHSEHDGSGDSCWSLSLPDLAEMTGLSQSSVQRCLKHLEEHGFLRQASKVHATGVSLVFWTTAKWHTVATTLDTSPAPRIVSARAAYRKSQPETDLTSFWADLMVDAGRHEHSLYVSAAVEGCRAAVEACLHSRYPEFDEFDCFAAPYPDLPFLWEFALHAGYSFLVDPLAQPVPPVSASIAPKMLEALAAVHTWQEAHAAIDAIRIEYGGVAEVILSRDLHSRLVAALNQAPTTYRDYEHIPEPTRRMADGRIEDSCYIGGDLLMAISGDPDYLGDEDATQDEDEWAGYRWHLAGNYLRQHLLSHLASMAAGGALGTDAREEYARLRSKALDIEARLTEDRARLLQAITGGRSAKQIDASLNALATALPKEVL
jgi:hypothetical protein